MERTTAINLLVVAILVGVAFFLVLSKPRLARAEAWALLRCVWPSWRFFEAIAPTPLLSVRIADPSGFGAWQPALSPPRRGWHSVVLNAEGNLHLAYESTIERLVQELDGKPGDRVSTLVSYQLVQRMIETALSANPRTPTDYQFKLDDAETGEPLFVSDTHTIGGCTRTSEARRDPAGQR